MFDFRKNDPEFAERFEHFAFEEVVSEPGQELDPVTRHLAILATLLGCQGLDGFREELPLALDAGVTPVMAKEVVYQAVDYLGIGRVMPFLGCRQPGSGGQRGEASSGGPGYHHHGGSAGKGSPGPGGDFWASHAGGLEAGAGQPLAGGQLLWRLLHADWAGLKPAGNDHFLLLVSSRRMRTPVDRSRQAET